MDSAQSTFSGVVCACGCGARFTPVNRVHRLATEKCVMRWVNARRRQARREAGEKVVPQKATCECGCGTEFCPRSPRHRFATKTCARREYVRRVLRKVESDFIGVSLIRELRREVPKHLCIYCERPLRGLQRFACDRKDPDGDSCRRLYNADWRRGARMRRNEPWRKRRRCSAGGCRRTFMPTHEAHCLCWEHRPMAPPGIGRRNARRMRLKSPRRFA